LSFPLPDNFLFIVVAQVTLYIKTGDYPRRKASSTRDGGKLFVPVIHLFFR
jgi:hypothetical protein